MHINTKVIGEYLKASHMSFKTFWVKADSSLISSIELCSSTNHPTPLFTRIHINLFLSIYFRILWSLTENLVTADNPPFVDLPANWIWLFTFLPLSLNLTHLL